MSGKRLTAIVLALALLLAPLHIIPTQAPVWAQAAPSAATWYVDRAATRGGNTGGSWADAYTSLQPALSAAQAGDQIWVAQGVYTPTNTSTLTATFTLKAGVALYGGFDPASGAVAWAERSWLAHPTVLSGDLGGDDLTDPNGVVTSTANIAGSNAYNVLSSTGLTETARLDGFYVTAGKADGSYPYDRGGGMYNTNSSPGLVNVTFSANQAIVGGGMSNDSSSPSLVDVTFAANQATYDGGGMYNFSSSSPSLVNVTFTANQANTTGGGMGNFDRSSPSLVNVTFTANQANTTGGGMLNDFFSSPSISNSILWGNSAPTDAQIYNDYSTPTLRYSIVQGGCPAVCTCENVIDADPLFRRSPTGSDPGDLRLGAGSPAIDAGNNAYLPADALDLDGDGDTSEFLPLDLDGAPRIIGANVDMGAYEAYLRIFLPLIIQPAPGAGLAPPQEQAQSENPAALSGPMPALAATLPPWWALLLPTRRRRSG